MINNRGIVTKRNTTTTKGTGYEILNISFPLLRKVDKKTKQIDLEWIKNIRTLKEVK